MNKLFTLCLIPVSFTVIADDFLIGTWQSNEELSLAYIKNIPNISAKKINYLSNDFFGNEKLHFSKKKITRESKIDGEVYLLKFNYKALSLGNNSYEIIYSEEGTNLETSELIVFENGCYYVKFDSMGLREYFCRAK